MSPSPGHAAPVGAPESRRRAGGLAPLRLVVVVVCATALASVARPAQGQEGPDARDAEDAATRPPAVRDPPPEPRAPGSWGGRVALELVVADDGTVREAQVREVRLDPAEPPGEDAGARAGADPAVEELRTTLAERARAYAESLRFDPAQVEGEAVSARVGFLVQLRPAESATPTPLGEPPPGGPVPSATPGEGADAGAAGGEAPPGDPEPTGGEASPATDDDARVDEEGFGATGETEAPVVERPDVAVSDFEMEIGELRRVPRAGAQSMLTLVPGVLLTQPATEGHALGMFLRGFDAAEGEDLEVLVDGMPINEISNAHGHGYVDPLFVIPQVVEGLRLVMGPFDPAQGDFAIAGTAAYKLGVAERGVHASFGYGRFGELRVAGWWAPEGASEGTFAALAYNEGDGFGPNRSFRNGSAMARFEDEVGPFRFSVLAFGATGTWRSAGVIRADDLQRRAIPGCGESFDAQFFCLYDPNQGGSTSQAGLVGRLRMAEGNQLFDLTVFGRARSLRIQENFTGFVTDPRTDGGPQRGDNLDQQYDVGTIGARGRYRLGGDWLGFPQSLELGIQLRYDDATTRADRRRAARSIPYRTEFDRLVRETLVGGYVRADVRVAEWLSLVGGVRLDYFGFNVTDRNFPEEDEVGERLPEASFSAAGFAASPRGTLRVTLVDDLDLVVAAGLGARSSDAAALSEAELAPFARVTALEAGLAYASERFGRWRLEGRASAFTTHVSQDLVFDPTAGRNSVLGPSIRSGVLGQARARWRERLDVLGSFTYTRGHLQPPNAGRLELFAGERLPFIPSWVARLDAAGTQPVAIRDETLFLGLALGVQYVGPRPLPLSEVANPYTLVDAAASARWRWLELSVGIQNLFDARFRSVELNYVSNFRDPELPPSMMAARHFSAGPPRTFLVTLAVHLDVADFRGGEEG